MSLHCLLTWLSTYQNHYLGAYLNNFTYLYRNEWIFTLNTKIRYGRRFNLLTYVLFMATFKQDKWILIKYVMARRLLCSIIWWFSNTFVLLTTDENCISDCKNPQSKIIPHRCGLNTDIWRIFLSHFRQKSLCRKICSEER